MFRRVVLSFGSESLRIFVSQREPVDAYTTVASLAVVFRLQPAAVQEELFGTLVEVPELSTWLSKYHSNNSDATDSPAAAGADTPLYFVPSAAWTMLVKRHVPSTVWSGIKDAIRRSCAMKNTDDRIDGQERERVLVTRDRDLMKTAIMSTIFATTTATVTAATRRAILDRIRQTRQARSACLVER